MSQLRETIRNLGIPVEHQAGYPVVGTQESIVSSNFGVSVFQAERPRHPTVQPMS
jgi:hypothetical protein